MKCVLIDHDHLGMYCERHQRYHNGKSRIYALGDDPVSIDMRAKWDHELDREGRKILNDFPDRCIHLGLFLTEAEVANYQEELKAGKIPCKTCPGNAPNGIPARHCRSKEAGPFTWQGKCVSCQSYDDGLSICQRALSYPIPRMEWRASTGVILTGGGSYEASLYVTIRMIRHFSPDLPITLFVGQGEQIQLIPEGVEIVRVHSSIPTGWPMKGYAMLHAPYARALYLDSDFYPTAPLENHFKAKSGVLCASGSFECIQWEKYGLTPDGRSALDGGFFMINRFRHQQLPWLYYYLNTLSHHKTYAWGCGDQDQLRASLRALEINYDSIGHGVHIGKAIHYEGVGVHRFQDKFRGKQGGVYNTLTSRPIPQGNLPYEDLTFQFFYEHQRLTSLDNATGSR